MTNHKIVIDATVSLEERKNCNVIFVDLSKGASNLLNYPQAAGNTRFVGRQISVLI